MGETIRVAIVGYGNLGRGVEAAIPQNPDLSLVGVFTRRDPASVTTLHEATRVYPQEALFEMKDLIDVLVVCAGSATDLPQMTPLMAKDFTLVDSFDNHAHIPEHFAAVDAAAQAAGTTAVISVGWDPGLFSLNRALAHAVLPAGTDYTFWGPGVSQGHSDAVRRIAGVVDARQYTLPVEAAFAAVRSGQTPTLTARQKHSRLVYVVAAEGLDEAEQQRIEEQIVTMPDYFADYDTTVRFISAEQMAAEHAGLPHGGNVFRIGSTGLVEGVGMAEGSALAEGAGSAEGATLAEGAGSAEGSTLTEGSALAEGSTQVIEYTLQLQSNPEFTASVLVAYCRAAHRMQQAGQCGCKTIFDIPISYLLPISAEQMRATLL